MTSRVPSWVGGRRTAGFGIAVLADDKERRMPSGRRLGELHIEVGDVADIGQHPDLGLSRLALDHRLELAVDRELNIAKVIRQRWSAERSPDPQAREVLEVVRDVLETPALVVDRERPRVPDGLELRALCSIVEIDRREQRPVGPLGELIARGGTIVLRNSDQ